MLGKSQLLQLMEQECLYGLVLIWVLVPGAGSKLLLDTWWVGRDADPAPRRFCKGTQTGKAGGQVTLCSQEAESQPCQELSHLDPIHKRLKHSVLRLLSWFRTFLVDAAGQTLVWCKQAPVLQQSQRFRSDIRSDWFYWHSLETEANAAKSALKKSDLSFC